MTQLSLKIRYSLSWNRCMSLLKVLSFCSPVAQWIDDWLTILCPYSVSVKSGRECDSEMLYTLELRLTGKTFQPPAGNRRRKWKRSAGQRLTHWTARAASYCKTSWYNYSSDAVELSRTWSRLRLILNTAAAGTTHVRAQNQIIKSVICFALFWRINDNFEKCTEIRSASYLRISDQWLCCFPSCMFSL